MIEEFLAEDWAKHKERKAAGEAAMRDLMETLRKDHAEKNKAVPEDLK